jgi:TonB family protein
MRWLLYSIFAVVLCSSSLRAVDAAKQQEAISRLEQATAKTNIFDLPSFELEADIQLNSQGKPIRGTYQLLWNGPDQWKEEIAVPGYTELEVGVKGNIFVQRSTDYIPPQIHDLHQALGFGSSLGSLPLTSLVRFSLGTKELIKNTRRKKEHGDELTCIEIEDDQKNQREACVRDASGTLARRNDDRDFRPVGNKVFPRILAFAVEGKNLVDVKIWELTSPAQFPPDAFNAPAGVTSRAGCMNAVAPRLVQKRNPQYPFSARMDRVQGTVSIDAWIGPDGVTQIRKVVKNPDAALTASAMEAAKEWRYDPALCNGQPVPSETIVQVNFSLSYH